MKFLKASILAITTTAFVPAMLVIFISSPVHGNPGGIIVSAAYSAMAGAAVGVTGVVFGGGIFYCFNRIWKNNSKPRFLPGILSGLLAFFLVRGVLLYLGGPTEDMELPQEWLFIVNMIAIVPGAIAYTFGTGVGQRDSKTSL